VGAVGQEWMVKPERGTRRGMRIITWFALTFGRVPSRMLLYPICAYFLIFGGASRVASAGYLRKALGREPRWRDVFRHFHAFASTLLDRIYLLDDQFDRFEVRVHGDAIVREVMARGTGCFLLSAHMGSFEIARSLARGRGLNVSLLMYEENAREMQSMVQHINPGLSRQVIALGKIDSMLKVEEALARGDAVGILADRGIRTEGMTPLTFLGEQAHFPAGPFRAAVMLQRPAVLMIGLFSGGNRYDIYFESLMDMNAVEFSDGKTVINDAMTRYVERLEHYCRFAPYHWFNFYDYWK
jgi:predicted LPLAT superfamily acyltransferase